MSIVEILILVSFILGFIPSALLFVMYSRTSWRATDTGKALFSLFSVTALSYGLSILILSAPELFQNEGGEWFRIVARFAIALVLWNMFRLFMKAQRSGSVPPETQEALEGLETARQYIDSEAPDPFTEQKETS